MLLAHFDPIEAAAGPYMELLASRLLYLSNPALLEVEQAYAACFPGDSVVLMRKMIADVRAPRHLIANVDRFDCALLTQLSWPHGPETTSLKSENLPTEMQSMVRKFEQDFLSQTPPRKLQWAHHLSRVTLDYTAGNGARYEISAGLDQVLILLALEKADDPLTLEALSQQVKLGMRDVYRQVKPLVSIQLVTWSRDVRSYAQITADACLNLNPSFENRKSKLRFAPVVFEGEGDEVRPGTPVAPLPQAEAQNAALSEGDKYALQCLIVRIAKKHKTVSAAHMLQQVMASWTRASSLGAHDVSDALSLLQDKEYLEYDNSQAVYSYLP